MMKKPYDARTLLFVASKHRTMARHYGKMARSPVGDKTFRDTSRIILGVVSIVAAELERLAKLHAKLARAAKKRESAGKRKL